MPQGKRILIIDDDVKELRPIIRWLEQEGYDVLEAGGGQSGFSMAMAHLPDLILLDIMMPDPDGFETLKRLQASKGVKEIPVVMLTAKNDLGSVKDAVQGGAKDYLIKPIEKPKVLLDRVKKYI